MANMNWAFYVSVSLCGVMFLLVALLYGIMKKGNNTSDQVSRLYTVVLVFAYGASLVAGFIALYFFNNNPAYMIQFLLALTLMMVPMALTALSVSTAQLATLRNTLAAGGQVGAVVA
jgi:ATP/ADP translocase